MRYSDFCQAFGDLPLTTTDQTEPDHDDPRPSLAVTAQQRLSLLIERMEDLVVGQRRSWNGS